MAAVLTLVRTPPERESCSFSGSSETPELPVDDGDTAGLDGLVSSGMRGYFGHRADRDPKRMRAPARIGYHGLIADPNCEQWAPTISAGAAVISVSNALKCCALIYSPKESPREISTGNLCIM